MRGVSTKWPLTLNLHYVKNRTRKINTMTMAIEK